MYHYPNCDAFEQAVQHYHILIGVLDASAVTVLKQMVVVAIVGLERLDSTVVVVVALVFSGRVVVVGLPVVVVLETWSV